LIGYTDEALEQVRALRHHYEALARDAAIRALDRALPAPRPYPQLARPGRAWIKSGRYWVAYRTGPAPVIVAVFFETVNIPGRLQPGGAAPIRRRLRRYRHATRPMFFTGGATYPVDSTDDAPHWNIGGGRPTLSLMDDTPRHRHPADREPPMRSEAELLASLARSDAELAAGQIVSGDEVLRELDESIARMEAKRAGRTLRGTATRR
jgi:hypothetical protein